MPYFLAGLRIAGGLALIGAIVAEFAAGSAGTSSGLAYRILESGYRLEIPRMFASLLLISLTGIVIFLALTLLQHLILRRWHESAARPEARLSPSVRAIRCGLAARVSGSCRSGCSGDPSGKDRCGERGG